MKLGDSDIKDFVDMILPALVRIYSGQLKIEGAVSADPNDDMIVAAAVESQSRYIISEDRHLLELGRYQSIEILNRDKFAQELNRLEIR